MTFFIKLFPLIHMAYQKYQSNAVLILQMKEIHKFMKIPK